jgi:hypothetical protein
LRVRLADTAEVSLTRAKFIKVLSYMTQWTDKACCSGQTIDFTSVNSSKAKNNVLELICGRTDKCTKATSKWMIVVEMEPCTIRTERSCGSLERGQKAR